MPIPGNSVTRSTVPISPTKVGSNLISSGLYPAPAKPSFNACAINSGTFNSVIKSGKPSVSCALPCSVHAGTSCAVKNTLAPVPPGTVSG